MVKTQGTLEMTKKLNRHIITGGFFLTSGLSLVLLWPTIINFILSLSLTVRPDNFAYNIWKQNPMPLYLRFHLFNWTNAHEVYNTSVKPHFEEIGPFVFEEVKQKTNITWFKDAVEFRQTHSWQFDRERSALGLDVKITTLNAVTASAAYQARNWGFMMKKGLQYSIRALAPKIHVTKTVGELLFDGYKDPFVTLAYRLPFQTGAPKMERFAWFYTRNGSEYFDGVFNMRTDNEHLGELLSWNNDTYTPYYEGECGKVHGSAGELYPPGQTQDSISFFSPDMCRNVKLDYVKDDVINGINGYRYEAGKSFLDNGSEVPENLCYQPGEQIPSGAVNISSCRYGSPGFVSLPHFYGADPYYGNLCEGLKPDKEKHAFQITLEPTTGIPLSVSARLQLNLLLRPVQYITTFENIPTIYFPVLWFEQSVLIPDHLAVPLKLLLAMPTILQVLGASLIILSVIVIACTSYPPVWTYYKTTKYGRKETINRKNPQGILNTYQRCEVIILDQEKSLLASA